MLERITGFIIICFAIWQIYTAYLAFKQVKQVGNKSTSPFIALGVWSGLSFGILMVVFGIALAFDDIH